VDHDWTIKFDESTISNAEIVVRYRQDSTIYDISLVLAACSTGL